MVFLLGDFNAQVGRNMDRWYPTLGKFRVGNENINGYRVLQFFKCNNLIITNTVFGHKWPISWHGIHVMVRQQTLYGRIFLSKNIGSYSGQIWL